MHAELDSLVSIPYSGIEVFSTVSNTYYDTATDWAAKHSVEHICCDRHFGGMPIEDVIAIVRKYAPEYFV